VVHILFAIPLGIAVSANTVIAGATLLSLVRKDLLGASLRRRVLAGLWSGCAAIAAYDITRLAYVGSSGSTVRPFHALTLFGVGLIGPEAPTWMHVIAGTVFHLLNGITFAVAFSVWFGGRGPLWGIGWALALELCMLLLYPRWFRIPAMGEFTVMSLLGHISYGTTLGIVDRRILRKEQRART
jgi:hypothetical protein